MKNKNKASSKIIKFLNGKGFYAVLCICFVAVGVAAWSGVQGYRSLNDPAEPSYDKLSSQLIKLGTPSSEASEPENTASDVTPKQEKPATADKPGKTNEPKNNAEQAAASVATFFVTPVTGDIMKNYSETELQYSITLGDMRLHKGIDIAAEAGTPVIACGNGKVTKVAVDAMLGSFVEIDHGNGITARYCGLNGMPSVKEGDIVSSATQIGAVDILPCESVEKRHLHLEFYLNGESVSPLKYIV